MSGVLDSAIGIDLGTPHSCFSVGQNERSVYYSLLFPIGYLPPFPVSQLERKFFFSDSEAKLSVYGADCTLASYGYDFVLFVLSQAEYFLKRPP